MLSPAWQEGSIEAGIKRRDAAVDKILATVTASDTQGKVRQLNKWLTENNQYNTTEDLNTIGNEPHECLAALEGSFGQSGPVCDGYARAMKVLCDRLEIPCVLVTGWARRSVTREAVFHMWNSIQVGGTWYAADITWNDPTVKGSVGARSGRENENFLLVGADTVVYGMAFNVSHVEKNQAAAGGVVFKNGPVLSATAFAGFPAFADVPSASWACDAVYWAVEKEITAGTGTNPPTFTPGRTCTETEILTFLWRAAGQPASTAQLPFTPKNSWAADALRWAFEKSMISASFSESTPCTRASTAAFIWRAAGGPAASAAAGFTDVPAGADYAPAVAWAVEQGITQGTGDGTTFSPNATCTRAEIVTFLYRAYK